MKLPKLMCFVKKKDLFSLNHHFFDKRCLLQILKISNQFFSTRGQVWKFRSNCDQKGFNKMCLLTHSDYYL